MLDPRTRATLRAGCVLAALGLPAAAGPLAAQRDSASVVPSPRYRAGPLHRFLLGREYRDLWTTPIRVEVLDPHTFAGGLRPTRRGGGNQTHSLRLQGADGREYAFRSVEKDQSRTLPPDLKGTIVNWTIQDQVSSLHPTASLPADALMTAAGILHVSPRLYLMPDDPFLGEFRQEFAGVLGWLEERPADPGKDEDDGDRKKDDRESGGRDAESRGGRGGGKKSGGEVENRQAAKAERDSRDDDDDAGDPKDRRTGPRAPAFAGASRIVDTEKFFEKLEDTPRNRLDSRDYLNGRLLDLFFGDWDRHEDQYRWARFERGGLHVWRAIPRDRDYVFVDYDGFLVRLAHGMYPKAVLYGPRYPGSLYGLTINAQLLDRRLLADLPRPAWDSVAAGLRARLPDPVLDAALRRMPREHYTLSAPELMKSMRGRRDRLPEVADRFYRQLAREAEVHGTDQRDRAVIDRLADGSVTVRLYSMEERAVPEPYFSRRYTPDETREVRVFLHGGADAAMVRGWAPRSILVRVIGGKGDDVMADSSVALGTRTAFYDSQGENRFVTGYGTRVDQRRYEEPEFTRGNLSDPPREWGISRSSFSPSFGWRSNVGPIVGGGPGVTRYGFRRLPFATHWDVRGVYAPLHNRFAVEYTGEFHRVSSGAYLDLRASASELEVTRFHGLGNETPRSGDEDQYKVWHRQLRLAPAWVLPLRSKSRSFLSLGPAAVYRDPSPEAGSPAERLHPRGSEEFTQVSAVASAVWDTRDSPAVPRSGLMLQARSSVTPFVWGVEGPFANTFAEGRAYLSLPGERTPTLALRGGAVRAWGDYPFQEAAFLGGGSSLRGYPHGRFAGDASVYGNAELRAVLLPAKIFVRGELGATALADAGRVYLRGESSDRWHTALGGGVWFAFRQRHSALSLLYARGERSQLYLNLGLPF